MSALTWIVCERSNRWAPALRTAILRAATPAPAIRLHEVRSLNELASDVAATAIDLSFVETTAVNLESVLYWLAASSVIRRRVETIVLLDRSLSSRSDVRCALLEAGALDMTDSPRSLRHVIQLGRRVSRRLAASTPIAGQSFQSWAWSLLPWQDMRRPLG